MKYKFINFYLLRKFKNLEDKKKIINIYSRECLIFPFFLNRLFGVYNGKKFIPIFINELMFGFKFGEFSPTKNFKKHTFKTKVLSKVKDKKHKL